MIVSFGEIDRAVTVIDFVQSARMGCQDVADLIGERSRIDHRSILRTGALSAENPRRTRDSTIAFLALLLREGMQARDGRRGAERKCRPPGANEIVSSRTESFC
jgi:hypothetical protein